MHRRQVLGIVGTGIVTSLAGCGDDTDYEDGGENQAGGNGGGSDTKLEILEHEAVREDPGTSYESLHIEGRAENVSDSRLDYVEVEARFYNEAGDQIETGLANTNDLDAGATWAFEIMFMGMGEDAREVASYDIGVGSNW